MRTGALLALILALPLPLVAQNSNPEGTLDFYWVDSEGGGSTLVVTPAGESILIDAGNPGRDAERIKRIATQEAGLTQIDHLIVTHFHGDHFGGAPELAEMMPILNVWDNGIPERHPDNRPDDTTWARTIQPYRDMSVQQRHIIQPGGELPLRGAQNGLTPELRFVGAQQEFVAPIDGAAPNDRCADAVRKEEDPSDNANSTVLVLEYGEFRFFHGGDLTWNVEEELVCPVNRVGTVDLYQVNHHGLGSSNNPVLVHSLDPIVSVMNNGPRKGTSVEAMASLRSSPSLLAMYQVHLNVREDTENNTLLNFIANVDPDADGNHIHASVAPDGKSYAVSVPANGHLQTYAVR